jgi:hypothetical protein
MSTKKGLFICVYGRAKAGKTVCAAAAASGGIAIALPGALLSVTALMGFEYKTREVRVADITDAVAALRLHAGKTPTILVDDLTLLMEAYRRKLEKANTTFGELWRMVCGAVIDLRDAARLATEKGTTVIVTAHEVPPKLSSGKPVLGGPGLPGQLPEQFAGMLDIVMRAVFNESSAPFQFELRTGAQSDYITGDRLNVFPDPSPMNLAEGLRAAGYDVPYPPGMEWLGSAVEPAASFIQKKGMENWRDSLKTVMTKLNDGKRDRRHIYWIGQDALHRAIIQKAKADPLGWLTSSDTITI